jgi:Zn-dependent protease
MSISEEKKPKAGLWALLAKFGSKLGSVFIKLLKALKVAKIGLAAASFAGYAAIYSWKFALLLMISVGFHESGHVWAMKKMGIKTKGFYFLPFVGGAAIAEGSYKTYGENAFIAIMGPVWGCGLAWLSACVYWMTGIPLFAAAAGWMAMINLFNLLPVSPLDGGQLVRSIAFSIHQWVGLMFLVVSMALGVVIMWKFHIGLFALLLIVGGLEMVFEFRTRIKLWKVQQGTMDKHFLPSSVMDANGNILPFPDAMNAKQIALTAVSFVATIAALVALLLMMKHLPGADIAANFLE